MWSFLRDHNRQVSKHVTTNLLLAMMSLCTSIFAYGFETSVLATIQAMDRETPSYQPRSQDS